MNLLIRADSSSRIGLGHIMRDIVMAQQYPQASITFACQELEGNINAHIPYSVHILNSNDPKELIDLIQTRAINRLIIDHYGIGYADEKRIKEATGVTMVILDDTYQKHCCDILINPNIYADPTRYKDLIPSHAILRCGKEFMLIRDKFYLAKKASIPKTDAILVAMGGSDPLNLSYEVIRALPSDRPIHLVTTHANPHLETLQHYSNEHPHIRLHLNTPHMAELMAQSALAIITPSSIAHEAIFMDLPFIAIQSAENQNEFVAYMKREGMKVMETFDPVLLGQYMDGMHD